MILINEEWILIDSENNTAIKSYSILGQEEARIIIKDNEQAIEVEGDLYNLIGFLRTKEDKEKYKKYLINQYMYALVLLENAKKLLKPEE